MIFGRKKAHQMQDRIKDILDCAMQEHSEQLARQQDEQSRQIAGMLEKNQKAVRGLSDSVEDFLDTMQKENEALLQLRQELAEAEEREQGLVRLLELHQEQAELFEQWITMLNTEDKSGALEAWRKQQEMLKGKIEAENRLCAVENTGAAGEPVDYRIHEILEAVEPDAREQEGTVAWVYGRGMLYHGTVIRKARVAAYKKS